jgi:hypothetical protein
MMDRRKFLGAAAAGAALVSLPTWLRRAFADDGKPCPSGITTKHGKPGGVAELFEGYRRAQRAGKPLLIFVIPENDEEKWPRGCVFGELLNNGTAEQLAPLALVEVACATMQDTRKLAPSAGSDEPLMVLVETDRVPAEVRRLDAKLESWDGSAFVRFPETLQERVKNADRIVDARIQQVAALIRGAVVGDEATVARRAAQARAQLGALDIATVEHALAIGGTPAPAQTDRAAALVAAAAFRAPVAARHKLNEALARAIAQRLIKKPPLGASWAHDRGCATEIEGEPDDSGVVIGCGMGFVPKRSERFLYFYARHQSI